MNATQKAFINLISNQLFMSDYKIEPDVDIKGLCEMACKHSLAALLYAELVKQPKSDKVSEASLKLYAHFFSTVSKSANQDAECGKVSKAFSEHKIRHLIVKGMAIKNDYPIAELRSMGDIDILIDRENEPQSDELMKQLGYEQKKKLDDYGFFQKENIVFEIHNRLKEDTQKDKSEFLLHAWEHIKPTNEYLCYLDNQTHFIYLIYHLAKHLSYNGGGVRMVMDVAVMLQKYGREFDWDFVYKNLQEMELEKFSGFLFSVIYEWFAVSDSMAKRQSNSRLTEELADYIINSGTFGSMTENQKYARLYRKQATDSTGNIKTRNIVAMKLKMVLPPLRTMRLKYKVLQKHWYLLPAFWVKRVFDTLLKKKDYAFDMMRQISDAEDAAKTENDFITKFGLR